MMLAAKFRRGAAAGTLAVAVLVSAGACSYEYRPETLRSYDPSQGSNAEVSTLKARNVVLVSEGESAFLSGGLNSGTDDSLTGVSAQQLNADGSDGASLPVSTTTVTVPANQLVQLADTGLRVSGAPQAGLSARLTLQFAKAGVLTMVVPILSHDHPDYASVTPRPAASVPAASASAPTAPASATGASAGSATATPSS